MPETVFIAMSGGVDSSAAALILVERGFRVVGLTLRLYDSCGSPVSRGCCALEDAADARAVASALGIEHRLLDYQGPFDREVIVPFVEGYAAGRTPNPCILCNERVKFGALWEYAKSHGADFLATGHHARLVSEGARMDLRRATDPEKDQSYVLFPLTLAQRRRTLLPAGDLTKDQLRAKVRAAGLPTADKAESQDICFIGDGRYSDFVEKRFPLLEPGKVRHLDGRVLGTHGGVHRFTVGQRRGLGIPFSEALYVVKVDAASGEVWVGPRSALQTRKFLVGGWNWHAPEGNRPGEAQVQVRYHQDPCPAKLFGHEDGVMIEWKAKLQCVTPGQAAVAYEGDTVVGGGWIAGGQA